MGSADDPENASRKEGADSPLTGEERLTIVLVDRDHLDRQTMNDAALRDEVLGLFQKQAQDARAQLTIADEQERRRLAHGLRGSAGGVGALAVADCAAQVEQAPGDAAAVARLQALIDRTLDEIALIRG